MRSAIRSCRQSALGQPNLTTIEPSYNDNSFLTSTRIFAAAASAGAIAATYARDPSAFSASITYIYARHIVAQVFNVYALRMAAVFLISQATLWLRTGVMPRDSRTLTSVAS